MNAYFSRETIVDKKQNIFGYRFLSGHGVSDESAATESAVDILTLADEAWPDRGKRLFVAASNGLLSGDRLAPFANKQFVLELSPHLNEELYGRCRQVQTEGLFLAAPSSATHPGIIHDFCNFINVDARGMSLASSPTADYAKHKPKLIACGVESETELACCKDRDIPWMQGGYFIRPKNLPGKKIQPASAHLLDLMNKAKQNAAINELEKGFKRDPMLSYKLLRFINSAGFGLSCEIQSLRHAISILGYQQLYKWLTLLVITAGQDSPTALVHTAIIRGRLTELLGQSIMDANDQSNLFVVGVFSLLDAILQTPMSSVLESVNMPEAVVDALLQRQGIYGPFLELTEACEQNDHQRIQNLAESLGLSPDQVNRAHLSALSWVEKLGN